MPRGDRTGPQGRGPMTGRRLGYCAGYDSPGYTRGFGGGYGYGFGWGRGRGWGRGWGWSRQWDERVPLPVERSTPEVSTEEQVRLLQNEFNTLKERLDALLEKLGGTKNG